MYFVSLVFFLPLSLRLIYPASCPWGSTALGRLLTQEKRALNVMSLCLKAWQSWAAGHLLKEINILLSSFSECNGLDITSPVGYYGGRIINQSYEVSMCVCMCVSICVSVSAECVSVCICSNREGVFGYLSVGGLRAQFEAICPLERKWSAISIPHQLEAAREL